MRKKYQIIFSDDEFPPISIGIKVGIFYDIDWDHYDSFANNQKIRLFTLCYRDRHKDFVKIAHVDLPRRLRQRYEEAENDEKTIMGLEAIGIHFYRNISDVIDNFHEYQELLFYESYKNNVEEGDMIYRKMLEVQDMLGSKSLVKKRNEITKIQKSD